MTTSLTLTHHLACRPSDYWATVLDRDLCKDLFLDRLGFAKYDVIVQQQTRTGWHREVRAIPNLETVPGFLRHAAEYLEIGDLDAARSLYAFRCGALAKTGIVVGGTISTMPHGGDPRMCIRVTSMTVDVPILSGGAFVANRMEQDLRRSYDVSAAFVNAWARAGGARVASP